MLVTWDLGRSLWGSNPLPYHTLSLVLHALTTLILGLWAYDLTSRRNIGLLAGALFGVFPLDLEAVGWLAAQWDLLAAFFVVTSLYCFTRYWRSLSLKAYVLSSLCFGLAVFTKESVLAWMPMYVLTAWYIEPEFSRRIIRRLAWSLFPFAVVLAVNLALRVQTWGNIGGYKGNRADYWNFFWDGFTSQVRLLLSPINVSLLSEWPAQLLAAGASLILLILLVSHGRKQLRLLVVSLCWIVLSLLPVLNLPPNPEDLEQNRFLYLASAGYCLALAGLIYEAIAGVRRRRIISVLLPLYLAFSIALCFVQLRPWHVATTQVNNLASDLNKLIPRDVAGSPMLWYIQNPPDTYKGAYLLRLGLDGLRYLTSGDTVTLKYVQDARTAPLQQGNADAFAVSFQYDEESEDYGASYLAGITGASAADGPNGRSETETSSVWDFASCDASTIAAWSFQNGQASCSRGAGLQFYPENQDPGMEVRLPGGLREARGKYLRFRVALSYPSDERTNTARPGPSIQWFWRGEKDAWNENRSVTVATRGDSGVHTYWLAIPTASLTSQPAALRFDPANEARSIDIKWIIVDIVK